MDLRTRGQWGHRGPLGPAFRLPVPEVAVHHSVTSQSQAFNAAMQLINQIGLDRFGRFSYQYCIHRSGVIGQGAGDTIGAHVGGRNSRCIGICFIGNYQTSKITSAQLTAFSELVGWLRQTRRISPGTTIYPHQAVSSTACPGNDVIGRWADLARRFRQAPSHVPPQGSWFQMASQADLERALDRVLTRRGVPSLDSIGMKMVQVIHPDHLGYPTRVGDLNADAQRIMDLVFQEAFRRAVTGHAKEELEELFRRTERG